MPATWSVLISNSFRTDFMANICSVSACCTRYTFPYVPLPMVRRILKSLFYTADLWDVVSSLPCSWPIGNQKCKFHERQHSLFSNLLTAVSTIVAIGGEAAMSGASAVRLWMSLFLIVADLVVALGCLTAVNAGLTVSHCSIFYSYLIIYILNF